MTNFAQGLELSGRASAAARALQAHGARAGRPVAALTRSGEILAVLAYAAAALPAPFFPIDPSLPDAIRRRLLEQAGDALVLGGDGVEFEALFSAEPGAPLAYTPPAGPALLIATSGSSAAPKAAVLTGDNLRASAAASAAVTPLAAGRPLAGEPAAFHIGGFLDSRPLRLGGADLVARRRLRRRTHPSRLAAERITHVSLTPTMLAQLAALGPPRRPTFATPWSAAPRFRAIWRREPPNAELAGSADLRHERDLLRSSPLFPGLPVDWRPGQCRQAASLASKSA